MKMNLQSKNTVEIPKNWLVAGGVALLGLATLVFMNQMDGENSFFASLIETETSKTVVLETSEGNIEINLFTSEAPNTTENFLALTKAGKYNNTIFHRVIPNFMIQAGDYENFDGTGGQAARSKYIADELSENLTHSRGMVSMANKGQNTNGSQFFIVQKDVPFLDGRHTIFGEVVSGMEAVDAIADKRTDVNDRPVQDIVIKSVNIQ